MIQVAGVQVRREVAELGVQDHESASGEFSGAEQILFASSREASVGEDREAGVRRVAQIHLEPQRDVAQSGRRPQTLTMRGEHGIAWRAGEIVKRAIAAEGANLRIALAAKLGLHD